MTYAEVVKNFQEIYSDLYEKEVDYWTAQLIWSDYVDGLCKDGRITPRQYNNWGTPFTYGKHLNVKRKYS